MHLKYTYEALLFHEDRTRSRQRQIVSREEIEEERDPLYSKNEATNIADLTAKLIKSNIDANGNVITLIILETPEIIVRFQIPKSKDNVKFIFSTLSNLCRNARL